MEVRRSSWVPGYFFNIKNIFTSKIFGRQWKCAAHLAHSCWFNLASTGSTWLPCAPLGTQPSDLARPGQLDLASTGAIQLSRAPLGDQPSDLARPGWFNLPSTGSTWLHCEPWLARFGCTGRCWAPRLLQSGCLWPPDWTCLSRFGGSGCPAWP